MKKTVFLNFAFIFFNMQSNPPDKNPSNSETPKPSEINLDMTNILKDKIVAQRAIVISSIEPMPDPKNQKKFSEWINENAKKFDCSNCLGDSEGFSGNSGMKLLLLQ